jgi:hypothetical protein
MIAGQFMSLMAGASPSHARIGSEILLGVAHDGTCIAIDSLGV